MNPLVWGATNQSRGPYLWPPIFLVWDPIILINGTGGPIFVYLQQGKNAFQILLIRPACLRWPFFFIFGEPKVFVLRSFIDIYLYFPLFPGCFLTPKISDFPCTRYSSNISNATTTI
jgi:hypothetical protein